MIALKRNLAVCGGPLAALLVVLFGNLSPGQPQVTFMAAITLWVAWWWVTEAVPIVVSSLLPFVLLPLAGIDTPMNVAGYYTEQAVFLFLGGFFISIALERWGLHKRLSLGILSAIGTRQSKVLFGVMVASFFVSMWISNTATVLMFIPAVLAIIDQLKTENNATPSKFAIALLIGLAYSATIGGMATLVGTPTNTIFYGYYTQNINPTDVNFASWFRVGFPASVLLLLAMYGVLRVLFLGRRVHTLNRTFFIEQYKALGKMTVAEKRVSLVFVLTALLWFTRADIDFGAFAIPGWSNLLGGKSSVQDSTVAIVMGCLLFLLPSNNAEQPKLLIPADISKVPYSVMLLFGGGFALAKGFEISGLSTHMAGYLKGVATLHPLLIIVCIVTAICVISEFASNVASIQLALPILAAMAQSTGIAPLQLMLPATLAASLGFMLPVATAPNLIVYGTGLFKAKEMARAGFWADVIGIIIISLFCYAIL